MNLDGVEPKQKIGAECSLGALRLEVGVSGREHADIDALGLRRADALHLANLQHAQQLRLLLERHVGDFIEEDGDRKSTRLNSSHLGISYAVFCLKKKKKKKKNKTI